MEINKLIRANIRVLKPYSSARDEFSGKEGIFLDANESPFGDLNRYPDPYQTELKSIVAKQKELKSEQVFVGNGSDEVIDLLFRIFCEPGKDKALTFSPTYGMYEVSAAINDIKIKQIPLNENFGLDLEEINSELDKGNFKLTFICSPNNPTGNAFPIEEIEEVIQKTSGIVVVDEAYIDFSETNSAFELIDKYSNLIVTQTMSKAMGLAAARVGFAFANEEIIELLNRVKPPYNVSELNQSAAVYALKNEELIKENIQLILSEREKLKVALNELTSVVKIYPSDTNFLLVQFKNADKTYFELVEQKIIVRNRHKLIENCIRITVGTAQENELLIEAIKQNEKSTIY